MRMVTCLTAASLVLTVAPSVSAAQPSIAERMKSAAEQGGITAAVAVCRTEQRNLPDGHEFDIGPIIQSAVDTFTGGDRTTAMTLMEAAR